jgi:hypothetical protein
MIRFLFSDHAFGGNMFNWLSQNKFQAHLTAFALMILTSIGMVFALRNAANALTWVMIAIFAAANVLALLIK